MTPIATCVPPLADEQIRTVVGADCNQLSPNNALEDSAICIVSLPLRHKRRSKYRRKSRQVFIYLSTLLFSALIVDTQKVSISVESNLDFPPVCPGDGPFDSFLFGAELDDSYVVNLPSRHRHPINLRWVKNRTVNKQPPKQWDPGTNAHPGRNPDTEHSQMSDISTDSIVSVRDISFCGKININTTPGYIFERLGLFGLFIYFQRFRHNRGAWRQQPRAQLYLFRLDPRTMSPGQRLQIQALRGEFGSLSLIYAADQMVIKKFTPWQQRNVKGPDLPDNSPRSSPVCNADRNEPGPNGASHHECYKPTFVSVAFKASRV